MKTVVLREKIENNLECWNVLAVSLLLSVTFSRQDRDSESIASTDGREYNFPKRRSLHLGQQSLVY